MNFYPFHIGDYARRTRHLTWDEDLAYRRLLDLYYTTEAPLPREVAKVCRLVVATTKRQRQAVQAVLDEFFEMTPEGWVNRRADEEISSMKARQAETEQKNSHESDRMKRYRDRRQAMFAALREVGVIPPWDIKIRDLERLYKEHVEEPATDLQRNSDVSGDAPATAIPIPIPTPTPTPIGIEREGAQAPAAPGTGDPPKRKPKATRGSRRCPDEFTVTDEMRAWAQAEAPHVDLERETAKFRDHTFRDARTDWLGTWRNWIRRAAELPPPRAATAPSANKPGRYAETIAALTGRSRPNEPETIDVVATEHPSAPRLG